MDKKECSEKDGKKQDCRFSLYKETMRDDIVRKESKDYFLSFETFAELLNRINGSKEHSKSNIAYCPCFGKKKHNQKWEGEPVDKDGTITGKSTW